MNIKHLLTNLRRERGTIVIAFATAILTIFFKIDTSLFIGTIVIISSTLFFLWGYLNKGKRRLFFMSISLFLLLHLLVFPIIYVLLLKYDERSLEFDDMISLNQKKVYKESIERDYNPSEIQRILATIKTILSSNSKVLDSPFNYVLNGNVAFADTFMIFGHSEYIHGPNVTHFHMNICSMKGIALTHFFIPDLPKKFGGMAYFPIKIYESKRVSMINNTPLKNLFSYEYSVYQNSLDSYNDKRNSMNKRGAIWSYNSLLPFTVNIFNTDAIKPVSPIANVIHFMHNILCIVLLIGSAVTLTLDLVVNKISQPDDIATKRE